MGRVSGEEAGRLRQAIKGSGGKGSGTPQGKGNKGMKRGSVQQTRAAPYSQMTSSSSMNALNHQLTQPSAEAIGQAQFDERMFSQVFDGAWKLAAVVHGIAKERCSQESALVPVSQNL